MGVWVCGSAEGEGKGKREGAAGKFGVHLQDVDGHGTAYADGSGCVDVRVRA